MLPVFAATVAAFFASLILTAAMRRVAPRWGLTDKPDSHRKLHGEPIPLGGGLAVFGATAGVLGLLLLVRNPWNIQLPEDWWDVGTFFAAGLVLVALGLVDDRYSIRGRHKLLGQILAAAILVAGGLVVRRFQLFGVQVDLGSFSYLFTMFWLVGAINAVNLMDGADGLAATMGVILSFTLAVMSSMTGHATVAAVACVFAGSLLGFLWFNRPPASIFLGDAGSMLIGMMVGAMAIRASLKGPGTVLLAAPLALLAIPIHDTGMAIVRRKLTGRSIYATDRGHLHHRLLDRLGSSVGVLACVAVYCAATCGAALASISLRNDSIALVTCVGLVAVLAASGVFGSGELSLLLGRGRNLAQSLAHPVLRGKSASRQTRVRLQGSRQWEVLWEGLTESVERLGMWRVELDVNLPSLQESFNATWEQSGVLDPEDQWRVSVPLTVRDKTIGRLLILGRRNGRHVYQEIEPLVDLLESFEREFEIFATENVLTTLPGPRRRPAALENK